MDTKQKRILHNVRHDSNIKRHKDMKYSIGVDMGGTNTSIGLVDENGNLIVKSNFKTTDYPVLEDFLTELVKHICSASEKCENIDEIAGVGIGTPNGNYYKGTIELAPNLPFKGVIQIKKILEILLINHGLNLRVKVTNDANAAGMGEMMYGAAKGIKNFVMITLGTGVGSAIIVDGKMVYGSDGFAGEVGHTIIFPDGRSCGCGRKGCLETYSSATGIRRTALELLHSTSKPSLLRNLEEEEINGKTISEAAGQNDALALECIDFTARILSIGLANTVAVTSPEKIVIAGGLSKAGELLLKPLRTYFEQNLYPVFRNKVSIELSKLDDNNAAILGAAALSFE